VWTYKVNQFFDYY